MYKEVEKMTNSKKMNPQKLKDMLLKYALYIILLLLLVVIVAIKPNFLSVGNLISILKQASTKGILAYGVAGIIILAGTDLSVGRVLGLCAAVAASMLQSVTFASRYYPSITEPLPLILPFLVCVAIAVIISAFNGFGMAKLHMHPFIVTLGTQLISYGLCCIYIENQPSGSTQALSSLDARYVGLATGATAVLVPEKEFNFQRDVVERIRLARLSGKTHFMIIVAEGVGSAVEIGKQIHEALGLDPRVTILGHIQRGGTPSARDRVMATNMGYHAVMALAEGKTNRVICSQAGKMVDLDIVEGLAMKKSLDSQQYEAMEAMTGIGN